MSRYQGMFRNELSLMIRVSTNPACSMDLEAGQVGKETRRKGGGGFPFPSRCRCCTSPFPVQITADVTSGEQRLKSPIRRRHLMGTWGPPWGGILPAFIPSGRWASQQAGTN